MYYPHRYLLLREISYVCISSNFIMESWYYLLLLVFIGPPVDFFHPLWIPVVTLVKEMQLFMLLKIFGALNLRLKIPLC